MIKTTKNPPPIAPATMSVRALADLLMLTPRRVQQLVAEGVIPAPQGGVYAVAPSVAGYCTWLKSAPQRGPQSRAADRALAMARLRQIEAQVEREAALLVPADEVKAYVRWTCDELISRMRALPKTMAMREDDASRLNASLDRIEREIADMAASHRFGARHG